MHLKSQISKEDSSRIHSVYISLLESLPLAPEHRKNLNARGLSDKEIEAGMYKSLPLKRKDIAEKIARQFEGNLSGVPGFWYNEGAKAWELAGKTGIVIPVWNYEGKINALKVRVDKPSHPSAKYLLLSSNPKTDKSTRETKYPGGTSARIVAHFPIGRPKKIEVIRITEGELKADIASSLTNVYTVSIPGVSTWRMGVEIAREIRPSKILLAFDSDKGKPLNIEEGDNLAYGRKPKDDLPSMYSTLPDKEDYIVGKSTASLYLSLKEAGFNVVIEDWPEKAGKGIDDVLIGGNSDLIRELTSEEADEFAKEMLAPEIPEEWVYVIGVKRFYHTTSLLELDKEQYADRYAHEEKGNPALKAIQSPAFPKFDMPTYYPNRPMNFTEKGVRYFNTWRPGPLEPKDGDITPFLDHAAYIVPDEAERETMLDWLAYNVQFPGAKILWAILLQGIQGTGKSYFGNVMRLILGEQNVSIPSNEAVHEIYTDWAKSTQLVIVEEVMAKGRLELMNKLKPMITQDIVCIREMRKPVYTQRNMFNLLMFTNHEDAIVLDKSDRRYCVIFSPAVPKEGSYYDALWKWTEEEAGAILRWMKERDLSRFKSKGHAPMTEGKKAVIAMSVPALQAWIEDGIAANAWPFMGDIVASGHLLDCLPKSMAGASPQFLGRCLKAAGAVQLGQFRLTSGSSARLWSVRRHEIWADAEAPTVVHEYEKWASSREPGGNPLLEAKPL